MSIISCIGNTAKNEYKVFVDARRAGQLGKAITGKTLKGSVIQAKYIQKQVGTAPFIGFVTGAATPVPGGFALGYAFGRIVSKVAQAIKK